MTSSWKLRLEQLQQTEQDRLYNVADGKADPAVAAHEARRAHRRHKDLRLG
jgi:hypothetical protein